MANANIMLSLYRWNLPCRPAGRRQLASSDLPLVKERCCPRGDPMEDAPRLAAKLLLADLYKVPAWASPAFIAVVLAAVAMLSIRDNRRATQTRQSRPHRLSQPVESAPGNADPVPSQPGHQALWHGGPHLFGATSPSRAGIGAK